MGTNAAPFLSELFLYYYESEFIQKLIKDKQNLEIKAFTLPFRYIDGDLLINNTHFVNWIPLIYLNELESTKTASYAPFLDIYFTFEANGQQSTRDNDKRDKFNFAILNLQPLDSNIPAAFVYGVYIS